MPSARIFVLASRPGKLKPMAVHLPLMDANRHERPEFLCLNWRREGSKGNSLRRWRAKTQNVPGGIANFLERRFETINRARYNSTATWSNVTSSSEWSVAQG